LITNEDFIRIDQTSTRSGQVMHNGGMIAWTSDLANGETALALFDVGESQLVIDSSFEAFGLDDAVYHIKDVWTGKTIPKTKAVQGLTLEPHSCILWLLKK